MALRVALVGCGRISELHLRAYAALEDADVVAVVDPQAGRRSPYAGGRPSGWEAPLDAWGWRLDPEQGGGWPLLFDDGPHKLALAWWLLGPVRAVHAFTSFTDVLPGKRIESPALASWQ